MGKWEFYDDHDEVEGADDQEPSFSLYEFKKWLDDQDNTFPSFKESIEKEKKKIEEEDKEILKEEFKQRMRNKAQKNIEKRLRKKKNDN